MPRAVNQPRGFEPYLKEGNQAMDDDNKPQPMTSDNVVRSNDRTVSVGAGESAAAPENKRDTSGDQTVQVRALKAFHKEPDMKGDMAKIGEEFSVDRHRAAQLRANGLIEYANETDEKDIHGETEAKRIADKVKHQTEAAKIPANSKTTPLRNPELKMAEVKDKSDR